MGLKVNFGIHCGQDIDSLPDDYLVWIETRNTKMSVREPGTRAEKWMVPREMEAEARRVLKARGFEKHGLHWNK